MNKMGYISTLPRLHAMFLSVFLNDTVSINQREYKINDRIINECETPGGMNWQGKEKY
jgi:hypothetical protein